MDVFRGDGIIKIYCKSHTKNQKKSYIRAIVISESL